MGGWYAELGGEVRAGGRFSRDESTSLIHARRDSAVGRRYRQPQGGGDEVDGLSVNAVHAYNGLLLLLTVSNTADPQSEQYFQSGENAQAICRFHLQVEG